MSQWRNDKEFLKAIDHVLDWEGGYVNDPDDPGGETKYGITKARYPNLNIKNLTLDKAKQLYYDDFWLRYGVQLLPEKYREIYFDMCVNMGNYGATKVLQNAINWKRPYSNKIVVDGRLGPKTRRALNEENLPLDIIRAYRVWRYINIIEKRPTSLKYLLGWFRRAIKV